MTSAGGRTQGAGLAAAAGVVLVIPAAGLLTDVPLATLAAILIFVATRLFHVGQLVSVFRFDKWEFGLAIVTLLTVAFVGVEQGIGVAVGLAILDRTRRSAPSPQLHPGQDPRLHELGTAQPPRPARDSARCGGGAMAGAGVLRQRGGVPGRDPQSGVGCTDQAGCSRHRRRRHHRHRLHRDENGHAP